MAENPFADRLDNSDPFKDPANQPGSYLEEEDLQTPRLGYAANQSNRTDDTAQRLEEIRRREAELSSREQALNTREEHVKNYGKKNFPPFYPLIFWDIEAEIPEESKIVVRTLYRLWLLLLLTLIINLVGCILLLVSGQEDGAKDMGAAIMYLPVISVTSFLLWLRPVYNAYMKEHAFFYYFFFLFGGFHIAFCIYMVVGIPSTGSAGLINMIHAWATGSIVTGVFGVIATVGWVLETLGMLFEYRLIWSHHNDKGHTFDQAKNEIATRGFMAYLTRGSQV